jgi:perosamine synthetase
MALARGASAMVMGSGSSRREVTGWLAREFGVESPVFTGSGTAALAEAMRASGTPGRTTILLPAYGCFDLVTAALGAGAPVRWYDVDPATLAPDLASLKAAISDDVAAIVLVHHYGVPADLAPIMTLAHSADALVIEDAAQGIGGRLGGKPLGSAGDLGILSFGRGKGLTAGGGGALLVNTTAGREAVRRTASRLEQPRGPLRQLVVSGAQWLLGRPSLYAIPSMLPFLQLGKTVFRSPQPVRQMNSAAIGILAGTVQQVDREAETRRHHAARLIQRLRPGIRLPGAGLGSPGYLRLPVLISPARRHLADEPRARALGIMPGYPRTLPTLPGPTASGSPFPGAETLVESLVTLPVHGLLAEADLKGLEQWLDEAGDA